MSDKEKNRKDAMIAIVPTMTAFIHAFLSTLDDKALPSVRVGGNRLLAALKRDPTIEDFTDTELSLLEGFTEVLLEDFKCLKREVLARRLLTLVQNQELGRM